ncbi:MAG: HAMP domain-containing histidine kinase [Ignavibacteria bacterium]|nr:HAMP domain-containing histidine kinase [Ignavibacteria bacterium]MBT8383465.1 HAMP domain-containing histidine kinase [Ignavibacteria bacterium]MBT8391462.1 HAMP domain-containing histidine kinase [Ignavibacteria bacterium]NNJ54125.1 HAMP domain-containing histidine kinase [Ignavibacteriaceae bacterium]NNL21392.1 HAMP domain-containing histidine kinase [Ignavibacteriaceae bacterium]
MKMSGGPGSVNIKIILLILALLIAGGTLLYTQSLVNKLQKKEREIVELYAKGIEYVANSSNPNEDITFLFDNIIKPIDFPLVLTDANDYINIYNRTDIRNIEIDSTFADEELERFINEKVKEMDETHTPIEVTYADSIVLTKIHYGDSEHIKQLRYYPYVQIVIAALFIILGYVGFSNIKRSEQSNIWVGMAKETAHQFGTPISSLMGWLEMLKLNYKDPDKVLDVVEEINNDVEKLNKITYRFSKIGAKPELSKTNVIDELKKVTSYFERRLPQTGRSVDLKIAGDENACAEINPELFEWVIENLIKNALDAIEEKSGSIKMNVLALRKMIEIEITDSGKGIDINRRKDVFRPGYSTKKRGWGLGLSLSKRIIDGYHGGKIFVKNSAPGEGTTFKILLRKC